MKLNLFARVELFFWDFTIQALSHSGSVRMLVRKTSGLLQQTNTLPMSLLFGASGLVGLVSGYMFYFVMAGLR